MASVEQSRVLIRLARGEDAAQVTELCRQLGYPVTQEEVRCRLDEIGRETPPVGERRPPMNVDPTEDMG